MADFKRLLSVVVCTHNRSRLLYDCLRSLVRQTADSSVFEIIVVDNNSTDTTPEVVQAFLGKFCNVRYVREPQTGLSHARNRGMIEVEGEYVAYIDDDAQAYPDWVEKIASYIRRNRSIVAFGGPYYALSEIPLPDWFPPEYGSFDAGDKELLLNGLDIFLCGTNMVFNRKILVEAGGFREDLGMQGEKILYGEETRLQIELEKRGFEIYYVPSIKVNHLIAAYKMKLSWLLYSIYAAGSCRSITLSTQRSLVSHCGAICITLASALRTTLTVWNIPLKRKLYYALKELIAEIAAFHEYLAYMRVLRK